MVEVPERFITPYVSALPPRSELLGILGMSGGDTEWAKYVAREALRLIQHSQASFVLSRADLAPRLPPGVEDASEQIWEIAEPFVTARTVDDVGRAMRQAIATVGVEALALASRQAPVIGWLVQWAKFAADVLRIVLAEQKAPPETVLGPEYDPDADAAYIQPALEVMRGRDWSWIWKPRAIGPDRSVRVTGNATINRAWFCDGPVEGWGAVPGSDRVWIAWFFDTDTPRDRNDSRRLLVEAHGSVPEGFDTSYMGAWDDYRPGARQFAALAWDRLQAPVPSFFVDHAAIIRAWRDWDSAIRANWESGPEGSRRRRGSVLMPLWARFYALPWQQWGECRDYWPWDGGSMVCGVRSVAEITMRAHRDRCANLLGTLTCAYVSRDDAAFADAELRDLLEKRRRQLLEHPAVKRVEVGAVPDADFRQAVGIRQTVLRPIAGVVPETTVPPAAEPPPLPPEPGLPPGKVPPPIVPFAPQTSPAAALAIAAAALFL